MKLRRFHALEDRTEEDYVTAMDKVVGIVALVAVLFLVARGLPSRYRLIAVAAGLGFAVLILAIESAGLWPQSWRTR
ncbi:MAG TPA: hypothetical protein VE443_14875 [Beijerinckiaceae bacterium]|jgi:hypothetical protein|nr:hypothetical protein [Beijerinckiaceae bacterium]